MMSLYLPCLAYAGGELSTAIALIEEGTQVAAVAPSDETLSLIDSSIRECSSRGARVILVTDSEGPIQNFAEVCIGTDIPGSRRPLGKHSSTANSCMQISD